MTLRITSTANASGTGALTMGVLRDLMPAEIPDEAVVKVETQSNQMDGSSWTITWTWGPDWRSR